MNNTIDNFDAISRVVQVFIDGEAQGDAAKLKDAFHADARMFGHIDGGLAGPGQARDGPPVRAVAPQGRTAPSDRPRLSAKGFTPNVTWRPSVPRRCPT